MKRATWFTVVLGLVFVFSSCGTEPMETGSTTSAMKVSKTKKDKHHHFKYLGESFETYQAGTALPQKYQWVNGGKSHAKVTNATARENRKKSLEISVTQDPTSSNFLGAKFCLDEAVDTYMRVRFSMKFENFVNWTGFGLFDGSRLQYWWWTSADGSVFDASIFATLKTNTWHDVEIVIDRKQDLAIITINGNQHFAELTQVWQYTDHASPMQCLFFFAGSSETSQTVYVDNISAHGH